MSRWLWLSIALLAVVAGGTGYLCLNRAAYFPEQIATHWDGAFQPNAFTSRDDLFIVFWLMPTIMCGVFALLLVLPWISPAHFKLDSFRRIYDYIVFLVVGLLTYMDVVILTSQMRGKMSGGWFLAGMFLFFGLLGNVLGKVRKNFWVGVRTPWTLASDVVWDRTHRLAAWLFVLSGFGSFVAVLCGVPALWCLPVLVLAALVPVLYSLILYKHLEKAGQLDAK